MRVSKRQELPSSAKRAVLCPRRGVCTHTSSPSARACLHYWSWRVRRSQRIKSPQPRPGQHLEQGSSKNRAPPGCGERVGPPPPRRGRASHSAVEMNVPMKTAESSPIAHFISHVDSPPPHRLLHLFLSASVRHSTRLAQRAGLWNTLTLSRLRNDNRTSKNVQRKPSSARFLRSGRSAASGAASGCSTIRPRPEVKDFLAVFTVCECSNSGARRVLSCRTPGTRVEHRNVNFES